MSVAPEGPRGLPAGAQGRVAPERVSRPSDHLRLGHADRLSSHHLVRLVLISGSDPECVTQIVIECLVCLRLYGCSRYEQTVQLLSSADWMTVVWKQGLYNYKDPFSLSARVWPDQGNHHQLIFTLKYFCIFLFC